MENITPVPVNDKLLLIQVQQGNKSAFDLLYEKYWAQAYSNAYKRLGDADQAKDIVQDIFISIWLKRETLIENLPAYLNISVRNRVFKQAGRQKNFSPFLDKLDTIPAPNQSADTNIHYMEFCKAYDDLLSKLPHKRQLIFKLRFQEDFTTKAIAGQMGITRKTVQNQLGKAIEHLRIALLPFLSLIIICI